MCRGFFLRCEDASAFQCDVDAELFPRQCRRILDGSDFDCPIADADGVTLHSDFARETAMYAIEAQKVRVGFDRAEIVDGNNLDVFAAIFRNGAENVTADAAKSVDGNAYCH